MEIEGETLVSVLIASYNYERFLPEAIESVLAQTYAYYELIICDDGSRDSSPEIIQKYADANPDRVRVVFKDNGGVADALNYAYKASSGSIICLLDADDLFLEQKLESVVDAVSSDRTVGLIVNRMVKVDESGQTTGLIPQFARLDRGLLRDQILRFGGHFSFAPTSGISLTRACADEVFPIPTQFRSEADIYILSQAALRRKVAAIDEPSSHYRLHDRNLSSSETLSAQHVDGVIRGLERMVAELGKSAEDLGFPPPRIEDNPVFAEMTFLRHYLGSGGRGQCFRSLLGLARTCYRARSGDRLKLFLTPPLFALLLVLPRGAGRRVLEFVYLPSKPRSFLAQLLLRARRSPE
jgi:glycosyltransferase involved in cell wall biosynthesis